MYCLEINVLILKILKHKKENQEMKTKILVQWVIPGMEADSIFNTIITIYVTILQKQSLW